MSWWKKFLNDEGVTSRYVRAGSRFGDAVSYLYMGECIEFRKLLDRWDAWEQEYVCRGFRTISLDAFIGHGGYGKSIDHLIEQRRGESESPVFHAQLYRDVYLGKVRPIIDLEKMMEAGEPQFGTYTLPSTEVLKDKK